MRDAYDNCERLVREADKDRFLAVLFAPAGRRPHLFALYAFNVEVARIRDLVSQPLPGEIRLQWWRDVVNGEREEEARASPTASALVDTLTHAGLPAQPLLDLLEARAFDLYTDPMPTVTALEGYCRQTSSTLMDLASRLLGAQPSENIWTAIEHGGIAYALTGLLRTFARHASRGQLVVPLDLLERHGVSAADVLAGRTSAGLLAALADLRALVRQHLSAAQAASVSAARAPALLPVALVPAYLERMERGDYDPFATAVEVPQWRRQWILWRAARRSGTTPRR